MQEIYVLVPVKRSKGSMVATILSLVLAAVFFLLSCSLPFMSPLGILFLVFWFFLNFRSYKEYEYSYFDGEFRFAKIMNKSRRKRLGIYSMDEVLLIAPEHDRSVSKYENDKMIPVKDYTSRDPEHVVYDLVAQKEGDVVLIKFEPDSNYLDTVEIKFKQKVIRSSEQ